MPAEAREALAEFFGDGRRQPGVDVFEAALPGLAFGGGVQVEQPLPTLARRAGAGIEEQVGFGRQPEQGSATNRIVFCENQLGYEQWIAQTGQRVVESLRGVDGAQLREIRFPVFTNLHADWTTL